MKRKIILALEDNRDLLAQFERMARKCDLQWTAARCADDAVKLAREYKEDLAGVVVDLMVPLSGEDVARLDHLLDRREEALEKLIASDSHEPSAQEQIAVGRELEQIDSDIDELIDVNGGMSFLRQARDYLPPGRVAILTTTDTDSPELASQVEELGLLEKPHLCSKNGQVPHLRRRIVEWCAKESV